MSEWAERVRGNVAEVKRHGMDWATVAVSEVDAAAARIEELEAALLKVRSYNEDIHRGRINYRPLDHIQVIDAVLQKSA